MRNKDEKHYRGIEKLTDNPFLNLYHIDALGRDGMPFHYYFASSAIPMTSSMVKHSFAVALVATD